MSSSTNNVAEVPLSGKFYGEIAFWFAITGSLIGIIGIVLYLSGFSSVSDPQLVLDTMLNGASKDQVWKTAAGNNAMSSHWYLMHLKKSDALALLGISIACLGAVAGMWGAFIGMLISKKEKERGMYTLYVTLVLIMAVLLTLSAAGIISIH